MTVYVGTAVSGLSPLIVWFAIGNPPIAEGYTPTSGEGTTSNE